MLAAALGFVIEASRRRQGSVLVAVDIPNPNFNLEGKDQVYESRRS